MYARMRSGCTVDALDTLCKYTNTSTSRFALQSYKFFRVIYTPIVSGSGINSILYNYLYFNRFRKLSYSLTSQLINDVVLATVADPGF